MALVVLRCRVAVTAWWRSVEDVADESVLHWRRCSSGGCSCECQHVSCKCNELDSSGNDATTISTRHCSLYWFILRQLRENCYYYCHLQFNSCIPGEPWLGGFCSFLHYSYFKETFVIVDDRRRFICRLDVLLVKQPWMASEHWRIPACSLVLVLLRSTTSLLLFQLDTACSMDLYQFWWQEVLQLRDHACGMVYCLICDTWPAMDNSDDSWKHIYLGLRNHSALSSWFFAL